MSTPAPGATAFCGTEPPYYETTTIGRMESMQHFSWENCVADWARNHPTPRVDRDLPLILPPATPPSQPGVDDSAQMWLAQHTDLAIAIAVIGIVAIVILIALYTRHNRVNRERAT